MTASTSSKKWQANTDRRNLMAKKKSKPIEEIKVEDTAVESVEKTEAVSEDEFIVRQLMVINRMPNRAKAQRLAERVLRNRKG